MAKKTYKSIEVDLQESDYPALEVLSGELSGTAGVKFLEASLAEGHDISIKHWRDDIQVSLYISNQGVKGVVYIVEGAGEDVSDALAVLIYKMETVLDWSVEGRDAGEKKPRRRFK